MKMTKQRVVILLALSGLFGFIIGSNYGSIRSNVLLRGQNLSSGDAGKLCNFDIIHPQPDLYTIFFMYSCSIIHTARARQHDCLKWGLNLSKFIEIMVINRILIQFKKSCLYYECNPLVFTNTSRKRYNNKS